jgi:peptide deformylase
MSEKTIAAGISSPVAHTTEDQFSMAELSLIKATSRSCDPLSVVSQPFDFKNPIFDPEEFANALAAKMVRENGIGLAAIQVGVPYRVFAIRTDPIIVAYNPKFVGVDGEMILSEEGCMSFPGLQVKVKRFPEVRMRFQTATGKFVTQKLAGLAARIAQHEYDHLDGVLFFNRASHFHRDRLLDKWEKAINKA